MTGLTSNPTIFDKAIRDGTAYDADIAARKASGASDEEVFFELALADLRRAAELFAPVHARTDACGRLGVAGGVARCWLTTPSAPSSRPTGLHRKGRPGQPVHQDPGHPRGPARHRGVHLRRGSR